VVRRSANEHAAATMAVVSRPADRSGVRALDQHSGRPDRDDSRAALDELLTPEGVTGDDRGDLKRPGLQLDERLDAV
jgi:hypothetical protein